MKQCSSDLTTRCTKQGLAQRPAPFSAFWRQYNAQVRGTVMYSPNSVHSGSSNRTVRPLVLAAQPASSSSLRRRERPTLPESSFCWNQVPIESPLGPSPLTPGVWTQPTRTNVCFWDDNLLEIPIDSPGVTPMGPHLYGMHRDIEGRRTEKFSTLGLDGTTIRLDKSRTALVIVDMQKCGSSSVVASTTLLILHR